MKLSSGSELVSDDREGLAGRERLVLAVGDRQRERGVAGGGTGLDPEVADALRPLHVADLRVVGVILDDRRTTGDTVRECNVAVVFGV